MKIITNNPLVDEKYQTDYEVLFKNITYKEILILVRDYIHKGHQLLTHPLSGSVKPNETPYKTIIISNKSNSLDLKSLSIIENSIETANKFFQINNEISESIKNDFKIIDLSLIENVINKL